MHMSMNVYKIIRWLLLALMTVLFLGVGVLCLMGKLNTMFAHDWGYPTGSNYVVGALEVFCALGLYHHKTVGIALFFLMVISIVSILTLLGHHQWQHFEPLIPVFSLLSVWGLMYLKNKREGEARWGLL